jgi:hypothetical protein
VGGKGPVLGRFELLVFLFPTICFLVSKKQKKEIKNTLPSA